MNDFEPIDIDFLINKDEFIQDAAQVKKSIRGIVDEGEDVAKKVDEQLNALFERTTNSLNEKAKKIQQAQNSIGNAADEIARMRAETDDFVESNDKATDSLSKAGKSFAIWDTALKVGLELFKEYGPVILKYLKDFFLVKRATEEQVLAQEALNAALDSKEYVKGVRNIIELRKAFELARDGVIDKTVAIEKYNELIGDTAGKANTLEQAEQGLIDNGDAYIEMTFKKAAANLALEQAAQKAVDAEQRRANLEAADFSPTDLARLSTGANQSLPGAGLFTALFGSEVDLEAAQERANKAADTIKKEGESLQEVYERFIAEAEAAAQKLNKSLFGDGSKDAKKIFDQRKKLLEQIAALDREYAVKQFDRDEQERAALEDKFDKIRKLVQEFNADPKNSKAIISLEGLDTIEENATDALLFTQETRSLKEQLEERKELYEDYEEYKKNFGTNAAKQRFDTELADFSSYVDELKQIIADNRDAFDAVDDGTATSGQIERVQFLTEQIRKATKAELTAFQEQLAGLQDYQAQRNRIIQQYQEDRLKLVAAGAERETAELDRQHREELDALDDANVKKTRAYQELFEGVGRLTVQTGEALIANARKLLETQNLSAETKARIVRLIAETEEEIRQMKADDIFNIANAFGELGRSLQELDNPSLQGVGGLLSGLAGGMGDFLDTLESSKVEGGDTGALVTSAINSIVKLVGIVVDAAKKRKEAEEAYYLSVIGLQQDYNISLNEQIRLQSQLSENSFITDYEGRIKSALEAVRDANNGYQEALKDLEKAQVITGQRNAVDLGNTAGGIAAGAVAGLATGAIVGSVVPVVGTVIGAVVGGLIGLFAGKKKKSEFTAILTEFPELLEVAENGMIRLNDELAQNLIANDLVNEKTKQILENIIQWGEQLEEARAQIREVITDLTGNLGGELRNTLVDAFVQGENAAIRMGETVESVLENVVGNLVFNRIFSDAFTTLEEDLAKSFDLGGDGSWIDDFSRFFNEAQGLTDDFNEALRDAQREAGDFGFDIFQPEDENQGRGLAGAIRRELTEETGSELTGLFRGQYDVTKRHLELAQKMYELDTRHYNATISIMQNAALTERNTRLTYEQLVLATGKLTDIEKNTKGGQSQRDLGLGG